VNQEAQVQRATRRLARRLLPPPHSSIAAVEGNRKGNWLDVVEGQNPNDRQALIDAGPEAQANPNPAVAETSSSMSESESIPETLKPSRKRSDGASGGDQEGSSKRVRL
jgi:hypothetical protein